MATAALVTLEQYLSSSYEPDREYIDGKLIERNVGTHRHSFLQGFILILLKSLGLRAYVELRLQIEDRFRLPDVLALAPGQKLKAEYLQDAPYIVVEILSPDDRLDDLNDKLNDYFTKSIPNIWVIDPNHRTLTIHQPEFSRTLTGSVATHDGLAKIDIADLFLQMDEDEA